jgi:alpha-glucosidase
MVFEREQPVVKFGVVLSTKMLWLITVILFLLAGAPCSRAQIQQVANGVEVHSAGDTVLIDIVGNNLAHVHVKPQGREDPRTLVMDPSPSHDPVSPIVQLSDSSRASLTAAGVDVRVDAEGDLKLDLCDRSSHCVHIDDLLHAAKDGELSIELDHVQPLYGMRGLELTDKGVGLTRNYGATIAAGFQGDGGGPFFFTDHLGVLVDSNGGAFQASGPSIRFTGSSRKDLEFYVVFGSPMALVSTIVKLTGLPQMPPKWTLGFLNSQWGTDEADVKEIVDTYRQKQIPLDAFILDFDWKAWGEDHYGEWRWNSTSGQGAAGPNKFPDGASGIFAAQLAREGVKLAGILKPRILLSPSESPDQRTEAAAYADAHHLWYPNEAPEKDYFTQRPARKLNFDLPETRTWFWEHLKPAFLAGMAGWWNDEADPPDATIVSNVQFLNMARMLYDGQRSVADQRVWSLNRNYYLGANRYGYALWSGDIETGFPSMKYQQRRMLDAMDLGASHWSMDTGGFRGYPTPENYARWMEFAAWVPIDRVHGDFGEKRQPWVYGPVAEAAATKAIRTRYSLLPYMYSYERVDHLTGIGIVRPMFWIFPDDAEAARVDTEWMFGNAFLVSPVVNPGTTHQRVYLPAGVWHDFNSGLRVEGGNWHDVPVDATTWSDVPVFVRDGSIIASQDPQQYVGERPVQEVVLDVFPNHRTSEFTYYDDDGVSYRYEKDQYFEQTISAEQTKLRTEVHLSSARGGFQPPLTHFIVKVHTRAQEVIVNGRRIPMRRGAGQQEDMTWQTDKDKFGEVAVIRVPSGTKLDLLLR